MSERLVAAAATNPLVVAVARAGVAQWLIEAEGAQPCLAELDDDQTHLVLSADLGVAPEERRLEVQSAALSYNALWRETDEARIVQAGATGELILVRRFNAQSVTDNEFPAQLARVLLTAIWWNAYATAEESAPTKPDPIAGRFGLFA
ncbi:MAG: type III secretion system chaperone [Pseudomonadota bacterium]